MARSKQVDEYMEQKFGKPLWKKSFRKGDELWTPLERQPKLFRVDPLPGIAEALMKQKVSENHIKAQVKDFLAIKHIFSFPIMQGLGSYAGVPDRVLHFRGRVIYLEIKKPGGKMSENQLAFQEQCRKDGITYWCVDSSEELNELLGDVEFCRILIGEQGNG